MSVSTSWSQGLWKNKHSTGEQEPNLLLMELKRDNMSRIRIIHEIKKSPNKEDRYVWVTGQEEDRTQGHYKGRDKHRHGCITLNTTLEYTKYYTTLLFNAH